MKGLKLLKFTIVLMALSSGFVSCDKDSGEDDFSETDITKINTKSVYSISYTDSAGNTYEDDAAVDEGAYTLTRDGLGRITRVEDSYSEDFSLDVFSGGGYSSTSSFEYDDDGSVKIALAEVSFIGSFGTNGYLETLTVESDGETLVYYFGYNVNNGLESYRCVDASTGEVLFTQYVSWKDGDSYLSDGSGVDVSYQYGSTENPYGCLAFYNMMFSHWLHPYGLLGVGPKHLIDSYSHQYSFEGVKYDMSYDISYSHSGSTLAINSDAVWTIVDSKHTSSSIPCFMGQLCSIGSLPDEFGDYSSLQKSPSSYMYTYDESSLFTGIGGKDVLGTGWTYSQDDQTITSPAGTTYEGRTTSRIEDSVIYFDFEYASTQDASQKIVMTLREPLAHYVMYFL